MAKSNAGWVQKSFVQLELDEKQHKACKAWQPTLDELDDILYKLTDEDYMLTFRYDRFGKCEGCWLQKYGDKGTNGKLILQGRGSTPLKALKQVLWKHKACDEIWPEPDVKIGERRVELDD
jgi:hypothetical protein